MIKFFAPLLLAIAAFPVAGHDNGPHNRHPHWPHFHKPHRPHPPVVVYREWIGPLVGGVVIGSVIADSIDKRRPEQPSTDKKVVCTEWREIQTSDGKIYRERSCRED